MDRRQKQPIVSIPHRSVEERRKARLRITNNAGKQRNDAFRVIDVDGKIQNAFPRSAPDGEHPMGRNLRDGFLKIVVHLVLRLFCFLAGDDLRPHHAFRHHRVAKLLPEFGSFGNALGNNMKRSLDCRFDGQYFFLQIDEALGKFPCRLITSLLPKVIGKRFQTSFDGNGSFRLSLGLIGKIQIFKLALAETGENFGSQVLAQLFLLFDGIQNRRAPRFEFSIVLPLFVDIANLDVVEIARRLLAISRDERDRGSLFK